MFEATLLGFKKIDFKNDAGERIVGTKLYICYADSNVTGYQTDSIFVKPDVTLPQDLKPNSSIGISCDLKGKAKSIQILKA